MTEPQEITWGTLSEKGWLREMVNKRFGTDRIQFLLKYKSGIPHRSEWGSICQDSIKLFTDKLITECKLSGGKQ